MRLPALSPLALLSSLLYFPAVILGNTEKTIFLAPQPSPDAAQHPALGPWYLTSIPVLSPANFSVRTHLPTPFASESSPGSESWFLLDELVPDQRYEVRVCWAATQPTAFTLSTHTVASILEDAELVVALSHYAASRASDTDSGSGPDVDALRTPPSRLLLRVVAAADYFTDDAALMKNPEPVHIDVILDPFLYNVLPRSLIPTIGYIAALVPVAWFVARRVSGGLQQVAQGEDGAAAGAKKRQ